MCKLRRMQNCFVNDQKMHCRSMYNAEVPIPWRCASFASVLWLKTNWGRSVLRILQQYLRICVPQAAIEKYSNIHWRHTNNSMFGCVTSTSKFTSITPFIQSIQLSPHQHYQKNSSFLAVQRIILKILNKSNCCWFHIISYTAFLLWIVGCFTLCHFPLLRAPSQKYS